jgi:putative oxidoreductase
MKQFKQNFGRLILRFGIGGFMLFHGISKLSHGIDGLVAMFDRQGLPGMIAYLVYLGEVVAPILLLIGYRTKLASLAIAITMVVAMIIAHADEILKLGDHGEWALEVLGLYLLGAIALLFLGGGKFAVSTSNKWD